jgi:hypothetical protein
MKTTATRSGGPWREPSQAGVLARRIRLPRALENSLRKQKIMRQPPASSRLLTRLELARALRISLTGVDRLVGQGLPLAGRRGKAKVYDLSAARRLARALKSKPSIAPNVLRDDYNTHTADLDDRRRNQVETWVADAVWVPAWRRVVAAVAQCTADWPALLAGRLGDASPADRDLLARADGPMPVVPTPSQHLTPERLLALLAGPVGAHPWRPAALPMIADLAARGQGIELRGDGAWLPWNPSDGVCVPATPPAPIMRPLLAALADDMQGAVFADLEHALVEPAPRRSPRSATTAAAAREGWRRARADYRRVRVNIRRGHRRRVDVATAILMAVERHTRAWWTGRHELVEHAGDRQGVRQAATRLQVRTIRDLETLGGLLPADHPRRSGARRRRH